MTISDNDNHTPAATDTPALTFYGKMLTFSRLQLSTDDLTAVETQLASMLSNKTSNILVIIDSDIEQDLSAVVALLWSWGLQPIGVVAGLLDSQAREQRMAIFPADGKRIKRILPRNTSATQISQTAADNSTAVPSDNDDSSVANNDEAATTPALGATSEALVCAEQITSLIYDQMLRSGQSLNHVGGDLILTNSVNSGAEAITDNSLHVYGRAQGRLVAGATGDKDARIFCQIFNPSLVSVAGTYCLRDNLPKHVIDKPVQVRFIEGEGLIFTVMDEA